MTVRLSQSDKSRFLKSALRAADWFVNSQLTRYRPDWDANRGRFLYYYFRPGDKYVPGINWTMGRALFVLTEAYKITRQRKYVDSAELGARYVATLQEMDPFFKKAAGAIRENIPQLAWAGMLDGAQAASGLLMLERVSGRPEWLRRGKAFGEYLLRTFSESKGFPAKAVFEPAEALVYPGVPRCMHQCTAMPLWHLHRRTGEKRWLKPLIHAANFVLTCQREDGAIQYRPDPAAVPPPPPNQHEGRGEGDDRYALHNDDGVVVLILAAHQATHNRKYLDAAVRYADWIVQNLPHERPYAGFPIQANNVLDIGRVAGLDYTEWVMDHLQKHLLDLQVGASGHVMADGGFLGEDEENEGGIFGGRSLDYVTTRVTCYAAGTLFRLSGKGTGAGFSVFGLE